MGTEKNCPNFQCIWDRYTFLLAIVITLLSFTSVSLAATVNTCRYPGMCAPQIDVRNCHRCRDGFVKDPEDDMRCKYANGNASLIISSRSNIKMISLDGLNTTQMIQNGELVQGTDYNWQTNAIFWFSNDESKIYTMPINGESGKKSIFHDASAQIAGLAVDWVHHHLYWVDWGRGEICVSNFNGTMRKVLFNDGLEYLPSIAVDPLNGWMYWSNTLSHRIERAGLDGSRREVILNTTNPDGLVVDYVENRLYWSQKEESVVSIWSSEFDGSDRKLVFTPNPSQMAFHGNSKIAIYDKYLYFIDDNSGSIYKVSKCNGKELTLIYKSNPYVKDFLMDIKIYEPTLQPEGANSCLKRLGRCSHFCFPVPSLGNCSALTTMCACPDGLSLSADHQSCG